MLYGEINRQRLKIVREHVVADTIDYLETRFAFSEDWDGLEKWVHFAKDGAVYDIRLTDDCIRKEDHLNLSAGLWRVYLHGNEFADGKVIERITTNQATLEVQPTGTLDGEPFPEIPASVTEQILARLENVEQNGGGSGGGSGGGITKETDPTVPDWAKQPDPPKYTASDVGAATEQQVSKLSAEKADKKNAVYILRAGETLDDVSEEYSVAMDPNEDGGEFPEDGDVQTDETLTQSGMAADAAVVGQKFAEQSNAIADLKGNITTVKDTAELEIIDETVDTATLSGGVLRFGTFVNRFAAVIVPDAVEIKVGVAENTEVYPDFQNANGALNDVGWWLLRKADGSGFIAVNPSIPDVYFIAEENNIGVVSSWSAISGAITRRAVGENYLRAELTGGKAVVYVDDAVVYTVDGIDAIGYASEHNKATTVYDVSVSFIGTCGCVPPATNGSGLTAAQISALDGMFKAAAYTKDITAEYMAFKAAFGIEDSGEVEPDEPVEPEEPEVTLTSISATYSGGDVAVGTALTDLTGIVVTATYSDGSTADVTGYTLSGEIAEGTNTITVSYSGMTATIAVTGVAESGGDTGNNGWTDGVPYTFDNWTPGYVYSNGKIATFDGLETSDHMPCLGASYISATMTGGFIEYAGWYDTDKTFISKFTVSAVTNWQATVPENAAYFRFTKKTTTTDYSVTPHA